MQWIKNSLTFYWYPIGQATTFWTAGCTINDEQQWKDKKTLDMCQNIEEKKFLKNWKNTHKSS